MADGASINQLRMSAVLETARGVTPATPDYIQVPIADGTNLLNLEKAFSPSKLIRSDREPGNNVGGVSTINGSLQMEVLREAGYNIWAESAFSNAFVAVGSAIANCTLDGTLKKLIRAAGSWLTDTLATRYRVGDTLFWSGSASDATTSTGATATATTIPVASIAMFNAGGGIAVIRLAGSREYIRYTSASGGNLNGCTRGVGGTTAATITSGDTVHPGRTITSITATDLVFANDTIVTNAVAFTATISSGTRILVPALSRKFYSVEQAMLDVAAYEIFKGVEANTMSHAFPTDGPATCEVGIIGTKYATGQVAGSTYLNNALQGRSPVSANVLGSSVLVDGAVLNTCVETFSFNVNNNRAPKNGVGEQFACFVEEGRREIELTFSIYFVDLTMQSKFQAGTRLALETMAVSETGDKYRYNFPKVFLGQSGKQPSGVTISNNFTGRAEYDKTLGASFYLHEINGFN